MAIQLRILGPLEVLRDGSAVQPTSAKQRLLLAVLLVHANQVVSVDALVEALWRDRPPVTAAGVLQTYVSQLRKVLEPDLSRGDRPRMLLTIEPGYALAVLADDLDATRFEGLVSSARAAVRDEKPAAAAELLREGLGLWRGSALADVADEEPVRAEAQRLDALRVEALEERVQVDIALGRHGELIGELTQLVAAHPFRERLSAQLMLSLYRAGRQADALGAYQELRRRLAEELGLDPGAELTRLENDILAHAPALDWSPPKAVDRVVALREPPSGSNLPLGSDRLAFVGRAAELDQLRGWWREDRAVTPMALVTGEAGVGKTRLVSAFAREVERDGAAVLYGRVVEAGRSSYEPVLGALRQFVLTAHDEVIDALSSSTAGALALLVPEMAERRPSLDVAASGLEQLDRSWLFGAIAGCMTGVGQPPTLLVLDDLQWADRPALLLLARLVEPDKRVRVLGTCRQWVNQTTTDLEDLALQLRRDDRPIRRVALTGLSQHDVIDLMAAIAGAPLSVAGHVFAADLHRRTDGHPFFIRETIHQLEDVGAISAADGIWASDQPFDELGVPDGVKDLITQRLSHLSPSTREALRAAAVVGTDFDLDIVAAVVGRDDEQVLVALEEGLAAGLVREEPARVDRYGFVHSLVYEVLLAELSLSRRTRFEWRTGEVLEARRPAELDERAGELARHFVDGVAVGDAGRAVDWCLRAGAVAMDRFAYEEAVRCYDSALRVLAVGGSEVDEQRIDVLIALGRAANRVGDPDRWRAACIEAAALARRGRDVERLAHAAVSLLGTLGQGVTDEFVVVQMQEAVDALRGATVSPVRQALLAELLARLSGYLTNTDPDRSAELADEALATARQAADARSLALALIYSTQTHALPHDEHRARLQDAARLAEQAGDLEVVLTANSNLMSGALLWADREEFDRRLSEYARVAGATGSPITLVLSAIDHAGAAALDGRYQDAIDEFRDALLRSERLGDPNIRGTIAAGMVPIDREQGALAGRVDDYRRASAYGRGSIPARSAGLVRVLCAAGAFDEATERLEKLLARPDVLLSGFLRRYSLVLLAEAAEIVGHTDAARQLSTWLINELGSGDCVIVGPNAYFGAVRRYLGLLALTLGDAQNAVEHQEAALDVHDRMRARGWAARSRYDLARALFLRGEIGDAERAARMVDEAASAAQELAMPVLLDELRLVTIRPDRQKRSGRNRRG